MTPLLTTLLPLVALLGSASAGTNKWTLSALNCRGTTGQDPPKAENSPIWLPAERSCTILKRSLDSPFLDGETSYHSICCKAFVPSPRLHPSQLHSMCVYSPAYISNIRDEKSCFSGGLDVQGCVSVSISPEPYRETITPEMPECDVRTLPTLLIFLNAVPS